MKPHAFVAMPFGVKTGHDGNPIDFDAVYKNFIKPALELAGCESFRADEEVQAGDIRVDMFQELLVADLVIADLTLDNPNVWYEIGVRHALRARGAVLVYGPRPKPPFDTFSDRKLAYTLKDGVPDPAKLDVNIKALADMVRATLDSASERKVSPVYTLLGHLREPVWRDLLLCQSNEFSQRYEEWARHVEVARRKNRPGDILVLAEETPTQALRLEAKRAAGKSLLDLKRYDFALEQLNLALGLEPTDSKSLEWKTVCLGRLGRHEDARVHARALTARQPDNAEAWALSGRVEKDNWISRWRDPTLTPAQMRERAAGENASLELAIAPYREAFTKDPGHFYSGINALTLTLLHEHLGGRSDPDTLEKLKGGVTWSVAAAREQNPKDYWANVSHAELCLLLRPLADVQRAFQTSAVYADRNWFALDSTRQTLATLRDLEFRPEETAAALEIVDTEISRSVPPYQPRQVVLFSGHMMDTPTRETPRFPPEKEAAVQRAIEAALEEMGVGPEDLALTQGAAGGDILFLEACHARGARLHMQLPFLEAEFIQQSIRPSINGDAWVDRFFAVRSDPKTEVRFMPDELGPVPKNASPFERCNLWLLYTALSWGLERVRFACVWDGGGGDGPGGTAHMYREVQKRTRRVTRIDVTNL